MQYKYLIKVSANANNNKYYEMEQTTSDSFTVRYGRVGSNPQTRSYSMRKWDSIYNSKLKKGYSDRTELYIVDKTAEIEYSGVAQVDELLQYLNRVSGMSFDNNYSVSSGAITEAQILEAQTMLDMVAFGLENGDLEYVHERFLELWEIIPRALGNVKDALPSTIEFANVRYQNEVDNIETVNVQSQLVTGGNILDKLGIKMGYVDNVPNVIDEIVSQYQYKNIWSIHKESTYLALEEWLSNSENKTQRLLWHSTDEANILSILNTSLLVRPHAANGRMLGNGIYATESAEKTRNYIRGNRSFSILFHCHVGNELTCGQNGFTVKKYTYDEISDLGYDCVYAPRSIYTGTMNLRNSEHCLYNNEQLSPAYIVEWA